MRIEHSGLAIIECRSNDNRAGSLRAHLETVAEACWDKPAAASSEIVSSQASFGKAFTRWAADDECRYLCIAGHGDKKRIKFQSGPELSEQDFAKLIASLPLKSGYSGIHLSTCGTITKNYAEILLSKNNRLQWISGYNKNVDWLFSLALDMIFLGLIVSKSYSTDREDVVINFAEKEVKKLSGGLCDKLGFTIYRRI